MVQFAPIWENPSENLLRLDVLMRELDGKTDLIVLPEMFTTGFSMNASKICTEENTETVLTWMQKQAKQTDAVIVGGLAVEEEGNFYNRSYWVTPNETIDYYDKRHLFSMAGEDKNFTAGKRKRQFKWSGWTIKPIVCYDLRFPEWCRNSQTDSYDLLICVASWPSIRSDSWLTLLKARAIENQAYTIGVNRVGEDSEGLPHKGDSIIYDPKGKILAKVNDYEESTVTCTLSLSEMHDFRKKFNVLKDITEPNYITFRL
jgi:predicted amidohydrolase